MNTKINTSELHHKKPLSKDIISKIKKEQIKPKPKLFFMAWNVIYVLLIIGLLLISGIISSIILSYFSVIDPLVLGKGNFLFFLFVILPIIWLVIFTIANIALYYLVRKTERGYKLGVGAISSILLINSIVLGVYFFQTGISREAEIYILPKIGFNSIAIEKQRQDMLHDMWYHPEDGDILGEILSIRTNTFVIKDYQGKQWKIDINNKTLFRNDVVIKSGSKVKIKGLKREGSNIYAQKIIPFYQK